jgi:hypothetical protein
MMESWVLAKWNIVLFVRRGLKGRLIIGYHPSIAQPSNIPSFHYSMIESNTKVS